MFNQETKICQNCKTSFVIDSQDFAFYEKMQVPAPTFCPRCRMQRRFTFRNQMHLYKTVCGLCGKSMVSMYSGDRPFPIYCQECWWSDNWDPAEYGRAYDFSKPFFLQYKELLNSVPHIALVNKNSPNSEYSSYATNNKNCYLCFSIGGSEDCLYCGPQIVNSKNCISCSMGAGNEYCYEAVDCNQCYKLSFSQNSHACADSAFLLNCRNCQNCIGCVNARSKRYCILNEPYSKEEYAKELARLQLGTRMGCDEFRRQFARLKRQQIHRFATAENCANVTGDNLLNSKNCLNCFAAVGSEQCCYGFVLNNTRDSYDVDYVYPAADESYENISMMESSKLRFGIANFAHSFLSQYVDNCVGVSDVFGCISLKKKQYCLLNRQYNSGEYKSLISRVVEHMDSMPYVDRGGKRYRYGEFFPVEISPFAYNESLAQEYFPLTRGQAEAAGCRWKDLQEPQYVATKRSDQVPENVHDADDEVLAEVFECEHRGKCDESCAGFFRILKQELLLYKMLSVPLPRICIKCRNFQRIRRRNPLALWSRKCMCAGTKSESGAYENSAQHFHGSEKCPTEFETTYAPDRPEIVYCESCYNSEVA